MATSIHRDRVVAAFLLGLLTIVGLLGCSRTRERPNVLLFMADSLRADALGCYGQAVYRTPNIDGLARQGVRFTRAFAQSAWTRDSIASLFTGTYHWTHGAKDRKDRVSGELSTLAERFNAAGYRTAAINGNPNIDPIFGFERGFDDFVRLYSWRGRGHVRIVDLVTDAEATVDEAISWLSNHKADPFFLFVLAIDPHVPYTPPAPYDKMYDPDYRGVYDGSMAKTGLWLKRRPPPAVLTNMRARYGGSVTYLDEQFGRLLASLDTLDLASKTIVVFLSDHGEEFYEHYDFSKRHYRDKVSQKFGIGHGYSLFREIVDVPLIMRFPGRIEPGTKASRRVSIIDIAPTVLDWLGIEAPLQFGGRSLRRSDEPGRDFDFAESFTRGGLLRQAYYRENWKIIAELRSRFVELYDLDRDPWEQTNLAEKEAERAGSMLKALTEVLARSERLREELDLGEPPLPLLPEETARDLEALGYID